MSKEETRFWEDRWQSFINASPLHKRRSPNSGRIKRWNKMAAGFAERTSDKQTADKRLKIIQWLKDLGVLKPDARVLDIGAGPGNWALLLAQTAAHVTALEPADAMVDIHPFNLVYAMGHRPSLQFNFWQRETDLTRDKAIEEFCTQVEAYTELTEEIKAKVAAFVDERCQNGTFTLRRNGCQGMMVWHINEKIQQP